METQSHWHNLWLVGTRDVATQLTVVCTHALSMIWPRTFFCNHVNMLEIKMDFWLFFSSEQRRSEAAQGSRRGRVEGLLRRARARDRWRVRPQIRHRVHLSSYDVSLSLQDNCSLQCDQMGQFTTTWALLWEPWALFADGCFLGEIIIYWWQFLLVLI